MTAAKIVGTVAGAAALLAIYLVLRAEGVRVAGAWALVPLVASDVFLFRFSLDPTFFHAKDPELYRLWIRLQREGPPGTAAAIRERFGARHVVCFWDEWVRAFSDRLAFEPGVRTLLVSEHWNVYEIGEPSR